MLVEEVKMSRSIMQKNYSHCPLKKRPVTMVREERPDTPPTPPTPTLPVKVYYDDMDEPENLSTKPEDLSKTGNYPSKASSPAAAVAPVDMRHWERRETLVPSPVSPPAPPQYLCQTSLEPLNLHTTQEMPTWHKPCPQYPAYLPISYYPEVAYRSPLYADSLSPYAPRDSSCSPPLYVPARHDTHRYMPYSPVDRAALSPVSSHASASSYACSSPPLVAAEDLTSPGSVSSDSGISVVSAISKKKKDVGAPRYQCPDCNKSYSTYSGLSKHQQFHCAASEGSLAKKSFSCKYCAKVYTSLGALKMHIRTHTLPCKCHLCGKAFSRPWLLQGHIRTHTGEKPFSCHHCHRAFADRSNLRAHLQTHSEVKKYSCSSCSKTFSRMSLLTKHMEGGCSSPLLPHPHYDYHPDQMQY